MKRVLWLAVCLFGLFCLPVAAASTEELYDQQVVASGADQLTERLPADTRELLEQLELDSLQPQSYTGLSLSRVLEGLTTLLRLERHGPLQALSTLLAVVAMSAFFSHLENAAGGNALRQTYQGVSTLAAGSALLLPLFSLLQTVEKAVDSVAVFVAAYVPVYAGVLAAGGSATGAISYQTTLLVAVELLTVLCRSVVLPLLLVSLALGCTGAVTAGFSLEAVSATIHKSILWVVGLLCTLFSGLLSLQQMVAAAGDSLGRRAVRFSLSSFVPVVGGLVSEAYSTVLGCAGLLRSTLGVFGLVATVLIVAPSLISCVCWNISLGLSATAAALFRLPALEKLCKTAAGAVRVLIGLLAVFALMMIISTTVVVYTAKGV